MVFQITESLPTYPEHQKSSYLNNQRTPLDLPAAYTPSGRDQCSRIRLELVSHSPLHLSLQKTLSQLKTPAKYQKNILKALGEVDFTKYALLVLLMDFKQGLDRTKNTPIILKAKLGIKLKVIMSSFISRLSSGQKSVASYCKMGR